MKKIILLILLYANYANAQISIIPQPTSMQVQEKYSIYFANEIEVQAVTKEAQNIANYFYKTIGIENKSKYQGKAKNKIILVESAGAISSKNPEAYSLQILNGIIIIKGSAKGLFYGVQTLLQIITQCQNENLPGSWRIPNISIADEPRFAYRGMHLDVCRHFFTVAEVKKYIDYLARYKFNTFHWHLTEDQGWRIEIKKYPKLTSVAAFRDSTIIGKYPGTGYDGQKHGGFYTQAQIKDVISYAASRYINIIPEIEMPGHSSAALAAYPQLGCTGGPYKVQGTWGVFDEVYCAGKEETFAFMRDVLDEVCALFPGKYVHIGGDECPKAAWKQCVKCQARIKNQKLKDEHELQSYFIQRIEKYINGKGKQIIGWDEILEGGLAPNATVMSWRGEEGGIEATKQNHAAIMTPGAYCYLDHAQIKNDDSLTIGGYTNLEKVYNYNPIPAGSPTEKHSLYLGAQGNVWTEYMDNFKKVEYQIFPRMLALSEVLWTNEAVKKQQDYTSFRKKVLQEFQYLDARNISHLGVEQLVRELN